MERPRKQARSLRRWAQCVYSYNIQTLFGKNRPICDWRGDFLRNHASQAAHLAEHACRCVNALPARHFRRHFRAANPSAIVAFPQFSRRIV